jgi:hypothetical protein
MKVFLGGTCNDSKWRDELILILKGKNVLYFNPVVDDWTPEAIKQEQMEKEHCYYQLYLITPEMTGVYSIAEAAHASKSHRVIFCFVKDYGGKSFDEGQIRSLRAVKKLIESDNNMCFELDTIDGCIDYTPLVDLFSDTMERLGLIRR